LMRLSFSSETLFTRLSFSRLSISLVMLGLSLKVALQSSCWLLPSSFQRWYRTLHCSIVRLMPETLNFFCSLLAMAVDALPVIKLYNSPFLKWLFDIQLFMQLCKSSKQFLHFQKISGFRRKKCRSGRSFSLLYVAVFLSLLTPLNLLYPVDTYFIC
jgi:hypothetical protein